MAASTHTPALRLTTLLVLMTAVLVAAALWHAGREREAQAFGYESSDRGMAEREVPAQGRTFADVVARFEAYRAWRGDRAIVLCRTTEPSWSDPFGWLENLAHERWKLPYIEPSDEPRYDYWLGMWKDTGQWLPGDAAR